LNLKKRTPVLPLISFIFQTIVFLTISMYIYHTYFMYAETVVTTVYI